MKKIFTALCSCAALLLTGCIDREFELTEVSGEMTIGGEELVVPIAEISRVAIGDLLKDNETLKPNEDGVYQIYFSSFGDDPTKFESISIDKIEIGKIECDLPQLDPIKFGSIGSLPQSFQMRGITQKMQVNVPTVGDVVTIDPVEQTMELGLSAKLPLSGIGFLSEDKLADLQKYNMATLTTSASNEEVNLRTKIKILKELKQVDWMEFGCEEHPHGTPFNIEINIEGLREVIGDGTMNFMVEFPEDYILKDADGNKTDQQNIFKLENMAIAKNQSKINILFYLYKIDCASREFVDGELLLEEKIKYSYDLNVNLCSGEYNLNTAQTFSFNAEPKYKDVEIVVSEFNAPNNADKILTDVDYTFNGLPSEIKVSKVAFSEAPLTLSLIGLEWLSVSCRDTGTTFSPPIEITLPECMHFKGSSKSSINGNTLIATAEELSKGITINIDYIDCTADGVKQENGQLIVDTQIVAAIHLEGLSNHTILVSDLTPPTSFDGNITMSISETSLVIDAANSDVTSVDEQSFPLNLGDKMLSIQQSIEVPEMIASIERIKICNADNTDEPVKMAFTINKATVFPVDELDIDMSVNLGKMLRPTDDMLAENGGPITKDGNGDYILIVREAWRPCEADLHEELKFEALENIPAIVDGKLSINQSFPVTGSAKIKSNENLDLSAVSDAEININLAIDDIKIRTFEGRVDMVVKPEEDIVVELGDMGDLGVDINSLSLNPVLDIKLDNPTGIAFNADLAVKTFDINDNPMATITVPTVSIGGGKSHIVISTPRNANDYKNNNDVTFVAIENLSKLLSNGIPAKIAVDMQVASNKNDIIEIDLLEVEENGYTFQYQYEVVIPLEFDGNVDLSCETTINGLNDTFTSLAEQTSGLKVGDVGLVAEFGTTIPFDIVLSAELVNKDGTTSDIDARLNINNCIIEGYNKEKDKGSEKHISKVDLEFDLGESGSLAGLKNADGVRLKFTLYNTDAGVATLSNTQYLDGKLKLRVRDGLTVDIFELLNGKEE